MRRSAIAQWWLLPLCVGLVLSYNATDYLLTGSLRPCFVNTAQVGHTAGLLMIAATLLALMATVVLVARLSHLSGSSRCCGPVACCW